eukprot:snap_masked-scaffold_4-processed-gene-11.24-mRNA-1 protein AED:0.29 eAED:0.29 QI:0/0/0/1/1/1/2/0/381
MKGKKFEKEIEEKILKRYSIVKKIGKGAYGIVYKAVPHGKREVVALKKCYDAFRNSTDAQRTYREVSYLKFLAQLDAERRSSFVLLLDVYAAENKKDLYLTFEFLDTDLYNAIRGKVLQKIHIQYILYQVVRAVHILHQIGLIHRDIKPSNVLLDKNCKAKLCDFGLCRSLKRLNEESKSLENVNPMTDYVATRWYRPPELLLGSTNYGFSIDIWGIGCVLLEMVIGRPPFMGSSAMNQIEQILSVIGRPDENQISQIKSEFVSSLFEAIEVPEKVGSKAVLASYSLKQGNGKNGFSVTELEELEVILSSCLCFGPEDRWSTKDLLTKSIYIMKFQKHFHPRETENLNVQEDHISKTLNLEDEKKKEVEAYRTLLLKLCSD